MTQQSYPPFTSLDMGRRHVLKLAGVSGALTLGAGLISGASMARSTPIAYVVTDQRLAHSMAFGESLMAQGATRLEVTQGLTDLWQKNLVPLWRKGGAAVAGLTSRAVWDCLHAQALGQFRKPRMIGRHSMEDTHGAVSHVLNTQLSPDQAQQALEGPYWSAHLGMVAPYCSGDISASDEKMIGAKQNPLICASSLISWIIV